MNLTFKELLQAIQEGLFTEDEAKKMIEEYKHEGLFTEDEAKKLIEECKAAGLH